MMDTLEPLQPRVARAALSHAKLDAAGRIDEDIPCRKCGYNLRSLLPEGRCPECNTAVGRSLQGDYLRFADPNWVESLASGMNWIVASIVIGFFLGGATGGLAVCMRWMPTPGNPWLMVPGFAVGLIAAIGYWKVTVADPSGLGEDGGINARKVLRFFQIGGYAINPLLQLLAMVVPIALWMGSSLAGVFGVVGTIAGFAYARRLAFRIPDEKLARNCKIVMWGMGTFVAASAAIGIFSILVLAPRVAAMTASAAPTTTTTSSLASLGYVSSPGRIPTTPTTKPWMVSSRGRLRGFPTMPGAPVTPVTMSGPGMMAFGVLGCLTGPLALVFGIWAIVIIVKLRKALNQASRQALAS